ncbi:hypothetical protein [Phenylobacterium sp.]|uniref:hypothetical protein n=1 Tax=Phenylobacterium sp. TaxID=1871053 RepID=UPI00378462D1
MRNNLPPSTSNPLDRPLDVPVTPVPGTEYSTEYLMVAGDDAASLARPCRHPDEPLPPGRHDHLDGPNTPHTFAMLIFAGGGWLFEFLTPGKGCVQAGCLFWSASLPFNCFRNLDLIHRRRPPGDSRRSQAVMLCGAGPWLLYVPFWDTLTTREALMMALPLLVSGNLGSFWLARDSWRPRPPRFWIAFSYAAAVVSGAAAVCGPILVWRSWWAISLWDYDPAVMLMAAPGLLLTAAGVLGVRRFLRNAASQRAESAQRPTTAPVSARSAG